VISTPPTHSAVCCLSLVYSQPQLFFTNGGHEVSLFGPPQQVIMQVAAAETSWKCVGSSYCGFYSRMMQFWFSFNQNNFTLTHAPYIASNCSVGAKTTLTCLYDVPCVVNSTWNVPVALTFIPQQNSLWKAPQTVQVGLLNTDQSKWTNSLAAAPGPLNQYNATIISSQNITFYGLPTVIRLAVTSVCISWNCVLAKHSEWFTGFYQLSVWYDDWYFEVSAVGSYPQFANNCNVSTRKHVVCYPRIPCLVPIDDGSSLRLFAYY